MNIVKRIWHNLFLIERPSIGLSFVRIVMALTTILYIGPTLCLLEDNYFSTAFKSINPNFFPMGLIEFVQRSPQAVIVAFVVIFWVSSLFFLCGFLSQFSCIVMILSCYYFQALNSFHIGSTLSWDILLVALFLFAITPYHGDYFSIDCLLKGERESYKKLRPFFVQRLLQLHVGFMYFYTALYKITAEGNWLKGNPLYYVLNYPYAGVTKDFLLRDFFMFRPALCYWLGIGMVLTEISMIFLLCWRKTRISAIYLSLVFHITLLLTLDVPAILFFVFPSLCFLFINPQEIVAWIEKKRLYNAKAGQFPFIYDGNCSFCRKCVRLLEVMDTFGILRYIDFRNQADLKVFNGALTPEKVAQKVYFIDVDGRLLGGFFAFRRICFLMPMLYPAVTILYFPGMGWAGPVFYKLVAQNRLLFNKFLPQKLK